MLHSQPVHRNGGRSYTIDGTEYPVTLDYDDLGRADRVHYPALGSGAPIVAKYLYDTSGMLSGLDEIGSSATKPLWRITEAFQGHLIGRETFGNGASTTYGYNGDRRWLENIQTTLGSNPIQPIQSLVYTHWKNGRIHNRTANTDHREYLYDSLNRLSSTLDTLPSGTRSTPYTYDSIGNITGRGATVVNYRTGEPHLVDFVGENNDNTYGYDLNGNVNERSGPDIPGGSQFLDYTPFDLPKTITTGSGAGAKVSRFEYSADEARLVRRDPDTTRYFVGGLYERLVATGGDTLEERFRLYAGSRQLGEIVRKDGSDQTLYFHTDPLGSVDTISKDDQTYVRQEFDPFGMPVEPPNPAITRVGFTGHEHDGDLGFIDMKGRIYDPLAARFTSADPVMQAPFWSQGLNRYSYVFNDPVNHTDPSGFRSDAELTAGMTTWTAGVGLLTAWSGGGNFFGLGFGAANGALSVGLGGYGGGSAGSLHSVIPSETPTSAAASQGSMHATTQNRGGVGPASGASGVGDFQPNFQIPPNEPDSRLASIDCKRMPKVCKIGALDLLGVAGGPLAVVEAPAAGLIGRVFSWIGRLFGKRVAAEGATVASEGAEAAARAAVAANKLAHIFGNAAHNLGPVVAKFGSEEAALGALQSATQATVQAQGLTGVFETVVDVGGSQVTVRGAVIDGLAKIGTAFIP